MREYLFRGKRLDNGEWVEGTFLHLNVGKDYICDGTVWIGTLQPCKIEVDPETVGQYTGMRDCKRTEEYPEGQMIFEGDIVEVADKYSNNVIYSVEYKWGAFMLKQKGVNYHIYFRDLPNKYYTMEVIGNIHDNPELLKGGDPE